MLYIFKVFFFKCTFQPSGPACEVLSVVKSHKTPMKWLNNLFSEKGSAICETRLCVVVQEAILTSSR